MPLAVAGTVEAAGPAEASRYEPPGTPRSHVASTPTWTTASVAEVSPPSIPWSVRTAATSSAYENPSRTLGVTPPGRVSAGPVTPSVRPTG